MKKRQMRSEKEVVKKKSRKRRRVIEGLLAVTIVLIAIGYLYKRRGETYKSISRVRSIELSNLVGSEFKPYKNGILKLDRDGAQAVSSDGKQFWNIAYNLKDAALDVCGSYVAIGDLGGNTVYVVNGSGQSQSIELPYVVKEVEVSSQGVLAVLTSNGEEDFTYLYRTDTLTPVSEIKTKTEKDGFPVNLSLSNDGKKLVTSYIRANASSFGCEVVFHNFSEVGQNYTDRLLGSWQFGNEFVADVEFLTNDVVLALRDNGMSLYSFQEVPKEITSVTFKGAIKSAFYNKNYVGFVVEKEGKANHFELRVYNLSGKSIIKKDFSHSYESIGAFDEHIVFYSDNSCLVLNTDGKKEFEGSFPNPVNMLVSGGDNNRFLALTDTGFDVIDLLKTKEK